MLLTTCLTMKNISNDTATNAGAYFIPSLIFPFLISEIIKAAKTFVIIIAIIEKLKKNSTLKRRNWNDITSLLFTSVQLYVDGVEAHHLFSSLPLSLYFVTLNKE